MTVGGEIILTAGEDGNAMYFISRGMAHVVRHEEVIATLKRGDFFGEVAIILQCPRTAHVVSIHDMELFQLKAAHLEHFMRMYARFQATIIKEARSRFTVAALSSPHPPKISPGAPAAAVGGGSKTVLDRSFDELLGASIWGGKLGGKENGGAPPPAAPRRRADHEGGDEGRAGLLLVGAAEEEWEANGTIAALRDAGAEYAVHEAGADVREGAHAHVLWHVREEGDVEECVPAVPRARASLFHRAGLTRG